MHRRKIFIVLFLAMAIVACPVLAASKTHSKKTKPKPAAKAVVKQPVEWAVKVNDDVISMDWFNRAWDASLKQITKDISSEEAEEKGLLKDTKKSLLEQMIEAVILLQWADKEGIDIKDSAIKKRIAEIKKMFPSPHEFAKSLAEQGMSPDDLKRDIKKQLIIDKLISMREKNLAVSDEEIQAFYDKNIELYGQKEKIKVKEIVSQNPDMIKQLRVQAEKGNMGIFDDIGEVERGQLPIKDDSAVFALDAGEISNIISGEGGYYVFLVDEKTPSGGTKLADVKDNIRKFLLKEKARTQYYKDLAEEKKSSTITVNEKLQYLFE